MIRPHLVRSCLCPSYFHWLKRSFHILWPVLRADWFESQKAFQTTALISFRIWLSPLFVSIDSISQINRATTNSYFCSMKWNRAVHNSFQCGRIKLEIDFTPFRPVTCDCIQSTAYARDWMPLMRFRHLAVTLSNGWPHQECCHFKDCKKKSINYVQTFKRKMRFFFELITKFDLISVVIFLCIFEWQTLSGYVEWRIKFLDFVVHLNWFFVYFYNFCFPLKSTAVSDQK